MYQSITEEMYEVSLSEDAALSLGIQKNRTFSQFQLNPFKNFDMKLLPNIIKYLASNDLFTFLQASWAMFKIAAPALYRNILFDQSSGKKLKFFLNVLQSSLLSQGRRRATTDYTRLVEGLHVKNIVFEEGSILQSWNIVKGIIIIF